MKTRKQFLQQKLLSRFVRIWVVLLVLLASCRVNERVSRRNDPDHDGVVVSKDKCPETPLGVPVDANGYPLDSDGDGVADNLDKCPDQAGIPETDGCPAVGVEMSPPPPPPPPPPPAPATGRQSDVEARELAEDKRRVTVFFCTNRKLVSGPPRVAFGTSSAAPRYGTCRVSIPRDHQMGQVEVPMSIFGLELEKPDPAKHIMVLATKLLSRDELLRQMNEKTNASARKDAFVFVHGFNNTFQQAMLRTAQFTYDLGFQGAPVLFSWPSQGSGLLYRTDEQMSRAAVAPFKDFLRAFLHQSTATNIYLIAHSMGNRVMLATLQDLMVHEPALFRNKHVREIVLTAPDVNAQVFRQQIAPVIKSGGANVTLYASDDDVALRASMLVNHGRRAGQAGAGLLLLPGMETIDATGVATDFLAHSYFASEGSVVGDLHYLFGQSLRADKRRSLSLQQQLTQRYWKVRKKASAPGSGK